jgi:hypothetical protein
LNSVTVMNQSVQDGIGNRGVPDMVMPFFNRELAGDTVWCPPDIDHWHGATPNSPMTHLVITGVLNGENVVWKEKVTNEEYKGK